MAISIECPQCQNPITIEGSRPGRFRTRCPKCGSAVSMTIPDDPVGSPIVAASDSGSTLPEPVAVEADRAIDEPSPSTGGIGLDPPFQPPRWLAGYRVGQLIGSIRSGASFEARRPATRRKLAMAIVKPRSTADAKFVARFAREAYATALLEHPNLIAPLNFDIDKGFAIVASDALQGFPIGDPRGREGLDRSARVAAILHAARALQHAHEQGIYHRDLTLAKIRVDGSGLVRLADLGVGLTPDTPDPSDVAPTPISLAGSPPSPAPEPSTPAPVRDDIAALGRSLQTLLGGNQRDRAIPPGLAMIARKMVVDDPTDRFSDLGAVVRTLEIELGVAGPFTPRESEAAELEASAEEFAAPPLARLRPKIEWGFAAAFGLFVIIALVAGKPLTAIGAIGFLAIVTTALIATRGILGRDPLFDRVRDLAIGGTRGDGLTAIASGILILLALIWTELLGTWIFLVMLAIALAAAYHFAVDRPIALARAEAIARASSLVRGFRRLGVVEDSVRRMVCRQLGRHWEEFFEILFGYDTLRSARTRWGFDAGGKPRPRFSRWRDPIIDAIDARIIARRRARDRVLFQSIEERNLEARGINLLTARRKGHRIAKAIVQFAHEYRRTRDESAGTPLLEALNRVAQRPEDYLETAEVDDREGPPAWQEALGLALRIGFGPRTRFLVGGVLLAGSLLWMDQNKLISTDKIKQAGVNATTTIDRDKTAAEVREIGQATAEKVKGVLSGDTKTKDLELSGLSPGLAGHLDGFGLGVAGLILILSATFRGVRFAAFAVPAAIIAAVGPQLIETGARPLGATSLMAMAIGASLFALGIVFGRSRE